MNKGYRYQGDITLYRIAGNEHCGFIVMLKDGTKITYDEMHIGHQNYEPDGKELVWSGQGTQIEDARPYVK